MLTFTLESTQRMNRQALIGIYKQHSGELYRYAYRLSGDKDLAEECVAETFSRLLKAIGKDRGPSVNLRAWLFRVAHNWLNDHYRKQPFQFESIDADIHQSSDDNPSAVVARQMEHARVRSALYRLPEDQRQIIELRFLEEWSHEQVAEALDRSVEATRALQHRAMAALRRLLLEEED